MAMNSSAGLGNLLRLQGLKSVSSRRKVLPEEEDFQEEESTLPEVGGTATPNVPQEDMQRGGIDPQSYDVRANQVMTPETEKPNNVFSKLGQNLALESQGITPQKDQGIEPPIETQQVEESEGLPPVNPEMQQEQKEGSPQFIPDFKNTQRERLARFGKAFKEQAKTHFLTQYVKKNFTPELEPQFEKNFPEVAKEIPQFNEKIQREQDQPHQNAITESQPQSGATDQVVQNPQAVEEFKATTGVDLANPETQRNVKIAEGILTDNDQELLDSGMVTQEQIARLRQNILSNQATDMDKYYIGLAIAMPLIIGGLFGKEAGLGALSGAAQGIGNLYGGRAKENLANEELLADINKTRMTNEAAGAKAQSYNERFRPANYFNPKTRTEEAGAEILPGFVIKGDRPISENQEKHYIAEATRLAPFKTYTQTIDDLTSNIIKINSQLKDKPALKSWYNKLSNKFDPGTSAKLSDTVELDGQKVNAGAQLKTLLGSLHSAYAKANGLGQIDAALQRHLSDILSNPVTSFNTPEAFNNQIMKIRDITHKIYLNGLENSGFSTGEAQDELDMQNEELNKYLTNREGMKTSSNYLRD